MLLNLLRVEDADPERMMALSFHQFQNERAIPAMQARRRRRRRGAAPVLPPHRPPPHRPLLPSTG